MILDDISQAIGDTPLLRLSRFAPASRAEILAKLELLNPYSIKDRPVLFMLRAAEADGVQIRSADEFALRDGRAPHAVRISINAHVSLTSFENAMLRLRRLLDNPLEQISV